MDTSCARESQSEGILSFLLANIHKSDIQLLSHIENISSYDLFELQDYVYKQIEDIQRLTTIIDQEIDIREKESTYA